MLAANFTDLLRMPYVEGAVPPKGVDCYTLVREYLRRAGVEIPADPLVAATLPEWKRTTGPFLRGDVVTFQVESFAGFADHLGVLVADGFLLHALRKRGVTLEPVDRVVRRLRVVSHLRREGP